jgi:formylglycine-generating enzyme
MSSCCSPDRPEHAAVPVDATDAGARSDGIPVTLAEIPAGTFVMGTDDPRGYAADGEGPPHEVALPAYRIGTRTVTNAEFAAFVDATGHRTTAEQLGSSYVFTGLLPDHFPPTRAVAAAPWWREVLGATWSQPEGSQSSVTGREAHPVVHVSWYDAVAYTRWAGVRLPTEAEWERAARGIEGGHHFPWGDEREPAGEHRMNVFQGFFPQFDSGDDGWVGTCPVETFPANDFGLHETTGNVWEWCADWFDARYYRRSPAHTPTGPDSGTARVMRGGSYLCHDSYCWRYRVDSRSSNTPDSSAGNVGFRVATEG